MQTHKKIFFPNLNGVRAIAAFMVIVYHVEDIKELFGLPSFPHHDPMGNDLGGLGVTLFFVLSGFLITYLLLNEKSACGTVSLRDFYIRRVLRIWPLYYLIVVLAFFVIPPKVLAESFYIDFNSKLLLFLFFLPNVAIVAFPSVPFAAQAWSVGVEEQFYLIWPILIKHYRNLLLILIGIVAIFSVAGVVLFSFSSLLDLGPTAGNIIKSVGSLVQLTRIDCMAIGGIGAYILFNGKQRVLNILFTRIVQIICYAVVIVLIYYRVNFPPFFSHRPYAVLFAILILNLAANPKTVLSINNRLFDYLGRISYGLYMYHSMAIFLAVYIITKLFEIKSPTYLNLVVYSASICLTIAVSAFSYELFEKFFLKKKIRFSSIISGDNAHPDPQTMANQPSPEDPP